MGVTQLVVPDALAITMAFKFLSRLLFQVSQVGVILLLEIEVVAIPQSCQLVFLTPASTLACQVEVTLLQAHRVPISSAR